MAKGKHRKPGRIGPLLKRPAIAVPLFVVVGVGLAMAVMALAAPRYSEWRTEREAAKEAARLERCAERARNETPLSAFAEGFVGGLVEGLTGVEAEDDDCPPVTTAATTTTLPPPTAPERTLPPGRTGTSSAPWAPGEGAGRFGGEWGATALTSTADVTAIVSKAGRFASPSRGNVYAGLGVAAVRAKGAPGTAAPALSFRFSLISSGRAYEMDPLCGSALGEERFDPLRRVPGGGNSAGLACFEIPRSALGDLLLLAEGHGGETHYWNVSQGVKSLLGPAPPLFP